MRYLGNKESLTSEIYDLLDKKGLLNTRKVFFDAFCGTGTVSDNINFYKYPHVTRDWRDKRDRI